MYLNKRFIKLFLVVLLGLFLFVCSTLIPRAVFEFELKNRLPASLAFNHFHDLEQNRLPSIESTKDDKSDFIRVYRHYDIYLSLNQDNDKLLICYLRKPGVSLWDMIWYPKQIVSNPLHLGIYRKRFYESALLPKQ